MPVAGSLPGQGGASLSYSGGVPQTPRNLFRAVDSDGPGSAPRPWVDPGSYYAALTAATARLPAPQAVLGVEALRHNAAELARRSAGRPIRVASKSLRVRGVLQALLAEPGFRGVLAYSLAEAIWLVEHGVDDVVVGYPTVDVEALHRLAGSERLAAAITLMVDTVGHLDFLEAHLPAGRPRLRLCLEQDMSLDLPRLRVGVWRSPIRTAEQARALAEEVARRPGVDLVGMMAYEAQIAGLGDAGRGGPVDRGRSGVIRALQRRSAGDIYRRRSAAVAAVRSVADLEFVNGGGTGSMESTAADPSVTEIAAGSGLFGPHLFDNYTRFDVAPAAVFCLSVVRRPAPDLATLHGGGWIASGPPGHDREPLPVWPEGLRFEPNEGAGEVQTPLRGAADLAIGDRVWLRHAKAGELAEHVNSMVLVEAGRIVDELPTYRGEGMAFL